MFYLDHINRPLEQTQRCVYGCATPAQRRGGGSGVKIFDWGVSLSKSLNITTTSLTYMFSHLNQQVFIPSMFSLFFTNTLFSIAFTHTIRMQSTSISMLFSNLGFNCKDQAPLLNTKVFFYTL